MADAQDQATQALRQVSSDIAHDLKTPLQRVALYLDDLERHQEDAARREELLGRSREEVAQMGQVFQALLQLARVEARGARDRFERVDLSATAATLVEMFEPTAAARAQSLRAEIAEGLTVTGDRALLGQMLSNLIENALRHAPEGSDILVRLVREAGGAVLEVADNGPGIPEAERARVRQRLYRLDRSRNTPGHGLGLSLVDAIVSLHGATLRLEENDPGLRARVLFPA
jgi:signal transduction histidine kinase